MAEFIPTNDLDRAIMALRRSTAATPEFYRQLTLGELCVLLPHHPELDNETLSLENGTPCPFVMLRDDKGDVIPIFSSEERLQEGLEKSGLEAGKFLAGTMPAKQVLEVIGKMGIRAVVNKSCATGEVTLPPDLMRDLADGSALQPQPQSTELPRQDRRVKILNPADYPTNLIQPVFEFVRQHSNFRAAWVFSHGEIAVKPGKYELVFLMQPRDEALFHDLNMTVQATRAKTGDEVKLGLLNENDAGYIASLFRQAAAFYVAADYKMPE